MKIPIFLLVLLISLDSAQEAYGRNRRSRMSKFWRTQLSRKQNSEAGGERLSRQAEAEAEAQAKPPSSSSSQNQKPYRPTGKDCKEAGFFPSPGSCLHFYRCVDWNGDGSFYSVFTFTCPVGTVFDDSLDVCNYPHAAINPECSDSAKEQPILPSSTSSTSTEPTTSSSTSLPTSEPVGSPTSSASGTSNLTCTAADTRYLRHPQYCNQYYYCLKEGEESIPIFTCPLGLVFDENNQICSRGEGRLIEDCSIAEYSTPKPVPSSSEGTSTGEGDTTPTATGTPIDITTQKTWEVDPESLFDCPAPGYYPFEGDCIRFYKCVETDLLQLKGLLYRCPGGFGYSEDRHRCLKLEDLPICQRVPQEAHIRVETATQLYTDDLLWFFNKN